MTPKTVSSRIHWTIRPLNDGTLNAADKGETPACKNTRPRWNAILPGDPHRGLRPHLIGLLAGLLAAATSSCAPPKAAVVGPPITAQNEPLRMDNAPSVSPAPTFPIQAAALPSAPSSTLTLPEMIWTNFVRLTNGRSPRLMSERTATPGWPIHGGRAVRNPQSFVAGVRGVTGWSSGAFSPWAPNYLDMQAPATLVTRRHALACGHCAGKPSALSTDYSGRRMFFVTANNQIIARTIAARITRLHTTNNVRFDYSIYLFNEDLPASIEPVRVMDWNEFNAKTRGQDVWTWPQMGRCQHGYVGSTRSAGHSMAQPGDSGHYSGFVLNGSQGWEWVAVVPTLPGNAYQRDLDELSRWAGLNPAQYQIQWFDLSGFPDL